MCEEKSKMAVLSCSFCAYSVYLAANSYYTKPSQLIKTKLYQEVANNFQFKMCDVKYNGFYLFLVKHFNEIG